MEHLPPQPTAEGPVADDLETRARAQLEALQQQHAQAYAVLAASSEWQRLIALEAAIGTLHQLIAPPAEDEPMPAAGPAA